MSFAQSQNRSIKWLLKCQLIMFLQGRNTGFGPRRIHFNCSPERKIQVIKKQEVIDRGLITSKSSFFVCFFFFISETLILYRQSETNCSPDTSQGNLKRLEHSIHKIFLPCGPYCPVSLQTPFHNYFLN